MPVIKGISFDQSFYSKFMDSVLNAMNELEKHAAIPDDMRISMPEYFYEFLTSYHYQNHGFRSFNLSTFRMFGIKVTPTHFENEVVVWHKDSAFYMEPWMVQKIDLKSFTV